MVVFVNVAAGKIRGRRVASVILDFLFVPANLHLGFVQGQVHSRIKVVTLVVGHNVVLVLSLDDELDKVPVFLVVDGYLDHGKPFEKVQKFFRLGADMILTFFGNVTVAAGNFNLHEQSSGFSGETVYRPPTIYSV